MKNYILIASIALCATIIQPSASSAGAGAVASSRTKPESRLARLTIQENFARREIEEKQANIFELLPLTVDATTPEILEAIQICNTDNLETQAFLELQQRLLHLNNETLTKMSTTQKNNASHSHETIQETSSVANTGLAAAGGVLATLAATAGSASTPKRFPGLETVASTAASNLGSFAMAAVAFYAAWSVGRRVFGYDAVEQHLEREQIENGQLRAIAQASERDADKLQSWLAEHNKALEQRFHQLQTTTLAHRNALLAIITAQRTAGAQLQTVAGGGAHSTASAMPAIEGNTQSTTITPVAHSNMQPTTTANPQPSINNNDGRTQQQQQQPNGNAVTPFQQAGNTLTSGADKAEAELENAPTKTPEPLPTAPKRTPKDFDKERTCCNDGCTIQ